jgi:CubicO group peptidase (beta-lactamase class C family)
LIGELVRRITGISIGAFFAEEVAKPLGADFFIGLPESEDARVSNVIPPPLIDLEGLGLPELMVRTLGNPPLDGNLALHEWWRRAEIPAANGHGNARSVAAIQSVIAGRGESGGVRLLSAAGTPSSRSSRTESTSCSARPPASAWATAWATPRYLLAPVAAGGAGSAVR